MRVNNAVNTVTDSVSDDDSSKAQQSGPTLVPSAETENQTAALSEGKRLEGQLDSFMFRSHLEASAGKTTAEAHGSGHSAAASGAPDFLGMRLGTNQYGEEVRVNKEVGDPQGYENRLQAIAVARMNSVEPAAVIQSMDGKWHAVQTTANFDTPTQVAADTPTRAVEGLPSAAHIDEVGAHVRDIRQELNQIDTRMREAAYHGTTPSPEDVRRKEQLSEELPKEQKLLASLVFGVPESEIQFNRSAQQDAPGKLNIDADMPDAAGMEHFDTKNLSGAQSFSISLDRLDHPREAAGTLYHELSHAHDAQTAQKWLEKFRQEAPPSKRDPQSFQEWIRSKDGGTKLQAWLGQQKGLSKADAEVVADAAAHVNVSTEARAYVHSISSGAQAGNLTACADQVRSYAQAIRGGKTGEPLPASANRQALAQELRNTYQHLPNDKARAEFKAAITKAAAEGGYPDLWITKLDFMK